MIPTPTVTSANQVLPAVKFAVSVKKDFNPFTIDMAQLIEKDIFLATRPACETDETSLQLIPYITLVDDSGPEPKFFIYTRGKASGEQRLIGKCSIGLGGHIEQIKLLKILNYPLINSVAETAAIELEEELGLLVPFAVFANAMKPGYTNTPQGFANALIVPNAGLLYNEITPTDVVHLGVSFVLRAKEFDMYNLELDVITRGRWMTYSEITTTTDNIELEVWSQVVLEKLNMIFEDQRAI
jgi:predicted NUDIX family phosphoesterase